MAERPHCPTRDCPRVLGALAERTGAKGAWATYEPRPGVTLMRCKTHGVFTVQAGAIRRVRT